MKRIKWIALVLSMLLTFCLSANAAENLGDWEEYTEPNSASYTVSGSTATINATSPTDTYAWTELYKYFEHAQGIMATINVTSSSGEWSDINLRKYIGTTSSGNLILAEVQVADYNGQHRIQYRVRERLTDHTTVRSLARGVLGDYSGMWETGEDVIVGLGVVGNDICFYTSKVDAITKVKLDFPLSPVERSIQIASGPENGGAMSGTVKDVTILYADDMKVLSDATSVNGGYLATSDLWIKAVINTVDGPINAVFNKSGEKVTASGATVVYGHFFANPSDVSWGDGANPDLYVKIWFDPSGRIDVNYFHVSVPDIVVYSNYPYDGTSDQTGTTTMDNRYIRHEYNSNFSSSDIVGTWNRTPYSGDNDGPEWITIYSDGTYTINSLIYNSSYTVSGNNISGSHSQRDGSVTWNGTISGNTMHITWQHSNGATGSNTLVKQ